MKAKFLYWLGKMYQKIGKPEYARKNFKKIILNQPTTYYGMRLLSSENILKGIFDTKIANQITSQTKSHRNVNKKTKSILRRSNFLFDILESDQAVDELFSNLGTWSSSFISD